jgi:hypothetical protein
VGAPAPVEPIGYVSPTGPEKPPSNNKSARTQVAQWSLPTLRRVAEFMPDAVTRIGEIINDKEHKDNFAACKLVVETLIRDTKTKLDLGASGIRVHIEMAGRPVLTNAPATKGRVIEHVVPADELEESV